MGGRQRTTTDDSPVDIGRRIDTLHEEDIRFLQSLRDRALRRSRALDEIARHRSTEAGRFLVSNKGQRTQP